MLEFSLKCLSDKFGFYSHGTVPLHVRSNYSTFYHSERSFKQAVGISLKTRKESCNNASFDVTICLQVRVVTKE
jgi:hypothetical protein